MQAQTEESIQKFFISAYEIQQNLEDLEVPISFIRSAQIERTGSGTGGGMIEIDSQKSHRYDIRLTVSICFVLYGTIARRVQSVSSMLREVK